jgi:NADPH:quinone reductase-like Zn-dependent oxidoreductase
VGTADFAGGTSAGASDGAIMDHWTKVPADLDLLQAAALPMAVVTAFSTLDALGVTAGQVVLVHGAGTTVGFAAVQLALVRGARVIATAGQTYAERLRALGAKVTSYGEGMVERVRELAGGPVDLALDTGPVSGVLPDLVRIVGDDPRRVFTIVDFAAAAKLGTRYTFGAGETRRARYDVLDELVQRAAEGKLTIPIARTFALEDWRAALDLSQSGHARGKLLLLPGGAAA